MVGFGRVPVPVTWKAPVYLGAQTGAVVVGMTVVVRGVEDVTMLDEAAEEERGLEEGVEEAGAEVVGVTEVVEEESLGVEDDAAAVVVIPVVVTRGGRVRVTT